MPTRLKPLGSVQPDNASVGAGKPVTVNVPEPATPTLKLAFEIAEMVGDLFTVTVNVCVAIGGTPLLAVTVQLTVPVAEALPLMVAVLPLT